ncbi:MAG: hypothetical protein ACI9TP_002475, partial [Candidatus Azotimanducaceae bacterium]
MEKYKRGIKPTQPATYRPSNKDPNIHRERSGWKRLEKKIGTSINPIFTIDGKKIGTSINPIFIPIFTIDGCPNLHH